MTSKGAEKSPDYRRRIYDHYVSAGQAGDVDRALASRAASCRALISAHFPDDREARGIDLGCGHGVLLHFAQQAGYQRLWGVDSSAEQVALAKQIGVANVSQGDLWNTLDATESDSQDLVISFDLIEHLPKEKLTTLVDGVHRVLREHGRWLISTPNAESPMFGRVRYGDLTHELAFTAGSLSTLLIASGFRHVHCHEVAPVPVGIVGRGRWLVWKAIRTALRVYLAAESGERDGLFTQNLLAVAHK